VLELRPNCEYCNVELPPDSTDARICSYECTFCVNCAERRLFNVCPNCGGGLERRPIRPRTEWRPGLSLAHQPASTQAHRLSYEQADIEAFAERLRDIAPNMR
jgi:hypothetical protein